MCVNCGSKEGEPLRWKRTVACKLQKGHMDPRKDLTYDNCIPQCAFCTSNTKTRQFLTKEVWLSTSTKPDFKHA